MKARHVSFAIAALLTGCGWFVDLGGYTGGADPPGETDGGTTSGDGGASSLDGASPPPVTGLDAGVDAAATSPYAAAVLADGPIAYWPLDDEPGSLTARDVVGGRDAVVTGSGVTFGATGVAGTAIQVTNRNAYLEVGDHFDFARKSPYTVEVWAQPVLDDEYTNVGEKRDRQQQGWVLYFRQSGAVQWEHAGVGGSRVAFTGPRSTTQPTHVVVTYDGAKLAMYVDNQKILDAYWESTGEPGPPDVSEPLAWAGNYAGSIDEIALYDKALPPERVTAHFKAAGR